MAILFKETIYFKQWLDLHAVVGFFHIGFSGYH